MAASTKTVHLPGAGTLELQQSLTGHKARGGGPGGVTWPGGESLASWLAAQRCEDASVPIDAEVSTALSTGSVSSVVELGCGTGAVGLALAKLGVPLVVATDGDENTCTLCAGNAQRAGLPAVTCCQLEWGDAAPAQLEAALGHVGRAGGQCAQWIVAGDVVYHPQSSLELEVTLRQLILRGGCSLVIISWCERGQQAEQFLWRLSDLGTVRTAFRERDSRFSFTTRRQGRLMQREVEHGISLLSIDGRGAAASTMSQLRQRWRIQWARANCAMAACIRRCRSAEQVRLQDR